MDVVPLIELVAVQPVRAYDKSSLDQFVIAAEHERERLQTVLNQAMERQAIAERRVAEAAEMRTRLAEMVEETHLLVARLRRENERAVAAILAAAEAEAEALVAGRRAERTLFTAAGHPAEPRSNADGPNVQLTVVPGSLR